MAGARGRKLDLSGYLAGNAATANIIANAPQPSLIGSVLGGIGGGLATLGARKREDKLLGQAKAEREGERTYQRGRDAKADARAESDQRMQEEKHKAEMANEASSGQRSDSLIDVVGRLASRERPENKIAADARTVEQTAMTLARATASRMSGMSLDPKVLKDIQRWSTSIKASGGPAAIMARAASQEEPDVEGLIQETAQLRALRALITQQMGREKNANKHAALGDALMQLESIVGTNEYRMKLYDANVKRKEDKAAKEAEAQAKISNELEQFKNRYPDAVPDLTPDEWERVERDIRAGGTTEAILANLKGERALAVQTRKDAEVKAREDERLAMARERLALSKTGFAAREERARASKSSAEYEKEANDAEQEVARLERVWGKIDAEDKAGRAEAKDRYDEAVASMHRIQANRPGHTISGGASVGKLRKSDDTAPAAIDIHAARAIFDREVKARGIDPNSDEARKLAEDIKAGKVK